MAITKSKLQRIIEEEVKRALTQESSTYYTEKDLDDIADRWVEFTVESSHEFLDELKDLQGNAIVDKFISDLKAAPGQSKFENIKSLQCNRT